MLEATPPDRRREACQTVIAQIQVLQLRELREKIRGQRLEPVTLQVQFLGIRHGRLVERNKESNEGNSSTHPKIGKPIHLHGNNPDACV